jgi:hypothetical protein
MSRWQALIAILKVEFSSRQITDEFGGFGAGTVGCEETQLAIEVLQVRFDCASTGCEQLPVS